MKLAVVCILLATVAPLAGDPSAEPLPEPVDSGTYAERYRVLADLDGDGRNDLLLSGGPSTFGSMGGPWTVYLHRQGDYKALGEIWAHPGALALEPDQARLLRDPGKRRFARIWVYLKSSGSAGGLGYYRVGEDTVEDVEGLEIYPGDGGTDLGRAIYEATFRKSPIPYTVERSTTSREGTVTWKAFER